MYGVTDAALAPPCNENDTFVGLPLLLIKTITGELLAGLTNANISTPDGPPPACNSYVPRSNESTEIPPLRNILHWGYNSHYHYQQLSDHFRKKSGLLTRTGPIHLHYL